MKLIAVVLARVGVRGFRDYFDGEIYVDVERRFYGPKHRWMFASGFVRPGSYLSVIRAYRKGYKGDMKGEGRLLGGCFVIGPGQQGILQEQRQSDWGNQISVAEVYSSLDKVFGPPSWVQDEERQHASQKKRDNEMRQRQLEYDEQEKLSEIAPLPSKKELLREIPGRRKTSAADANAKML